MRIIARRAEHGTIVHWLAVVWASYIELANAESVNSSAPSVIAIAKSGEERVLERPSTFRKAKLAVKRLEDELLIVGQNNFCESHGLPDEFRDTSL